jgi:hypothetical protein
LNIIFALAMVHARQPVTAHEENGAVGIGPIAESQVYYQRASALFNENMVGNSGTSIEVGALARGPDASLYNTNSQ